MRLTFSRLDALLLLMVLIWGSNFSIIKTALRELPELGFNALRMALAAAVFGAVIARRHGLRAALTAFDRREWRLVVALSIIGHVLYQLLFMGGVARTAVANSSLIFGSTPIAVGLLSSALGHERITRVRWAGTLLSALGIYFVVGHRADPGASLLGDFLIFCAMLAWATFSVGSRALLVRHSPLVVTGVTMLIGAAVYAPFGVPSLLRTDLGRVTATTWALLVYSAVFALVVAYLIWYTGVQKVGNNRTSIYSNLTPVVAMAIAAVALGEPLSASKLAGAAAILGGIALTRVETGTADKEAAPSEG